MWWEPRSEAERDLFGEVSRLLDLYQGGLHDGLVRGVGAGAPDETPGPGSGRLSPVAREWRPLVLVDDRSVGFSPTAGRRLELDEVDRESPAAAFLRAWDLRGDTLVEPVGPIVPAVRPGDPHVGAGQATVGLPVLTHAPNGDPSDRSVPGFLTVAHGVGGHGSAVRVSTAGGGSATGVVTFREEGAGGGKGGDDIALVALDPPFGVSGWLVNQGLRPPPSGPPYVDVDVDLFGSVSVSVIGQVSGVLRQVGDQTWQWTDCWEIGVTSPSMQRGDSGALTIDTSPTPFVLGHFVGGAVPIRSGGGSTFVRHWVQDLGRVLAHQPALAGMITY